jgi:hypothetical protein
MTTKRTALTTIFLVLCLASAAFLALSTLNYIEFFRALEKFTIELRNVELLVGQKNATVGITFEMWNPTGYVGFALREWSYRLTFKASNQSIDLSYDTISYAEPITISPQWNKTFEHETTIDITKPTHFQFITLYQLNQGKEVTWTLEVGVILLNPLTGQLDIPLSSSLKSEL